MELYDISIGARVKHPTMGIGVVYQMDERTVHIFFKEHGEQPISRSFEGLVTIAPGVEIGTAELDMESVKDALRDVLAEANVPERRIDLARKFQGGTLELRPKDVSGQVSYYRTPAKPNYVYTMNGRVETHDASASTDLEWDEVATINILVRSLQLAGIKSADQLLAQTMNQNKMTEE